MSSVGWVIFKLWFFISLLFLSLFVEEPEGVMVVEMCKFECKLNYIHVYNTIIPVLIFGIYWVGGNRKITMRRLLLLCVN